MWALAWYPQIYIIVSQVPIYFSVIHTVCPYGGHALHVRVCPCMDSDSSAALRAPRDDIDLRRFRHDPTSAHHRHRRQPTARRPCHTTADAHETPTAARCRTTRSDAPEPTARRPCQPTTTAATTELTSEK